MASTSFCDITLFRVTLVQHAAEMAIAVLGEPNLRLCGGRELRFGNRGSLAVAIDGPKAGLWYDHENGEGGDLSAERAQRAPKPLCGLRQWLNVDGCQGFNTAVMLRFSDWP